MAAELSVIELDVGQSALIVGMDDRGMSVRAVAATGAASDADATEQAPDIVAALVMRLRTDPAFREELDSLFISGGPDGGTDGTPDAAVPTYGGDVSGQRPAWLAARARRWVSTISGGPVLITLAPGEAALTFNDGGNRWGAPLPEDYAKTGEAEGLVFMLLMKLTVEASFYNEMLTWYFMQDDQA